MVVGFGSAVCRETPHVMRNEILASKQKSEVCSFDLTSGRREEREKKKHITRRVRQKA
jgi:hypothetical protein